MMNKPTKIAGLGAIAALAAALPAWAQEVVVAGPIKAPDAVAMAGMVNKGDTTWMLVSSALVLLMAIPALGLFYGGLVRTKNMLSVLMQVFRWQPLYRRLLQGIPGKRQRGHLCCDLLEQRLYPGIRLRHLPDDLCLHYPRPDRRRLR